MLLFLFPYIFLNDFTWEAFVIVNFYFVCLWVIIENLFSFSRFVRLFPKVFTDSIMSSSPSVSSGVPPSFPSLEGRPENSSESESEADAVERRQLTANIRHNRRLTRRAYRRFARLLTRCTPEVIGAELAAEIRVMFGEAEPQHLLSSDGGSSGDEEADMALLANLPGGPDKDEKDGKEDQDPSPKSTAKLSVSVC